jgi:hypothetical protein
VAGPSASAVRNGELPTAAVEWLKANFFKTELELGHCLRLPAEGPCECDLYLTCAKFVTTAAYTPRLRQRHATELALAAEAAEHGWSREVERHAATARRIANLLDELHEPLCPDDSRSTGDGNPGLRLGMTVETLPRDGSRGLAGSSEDKPIAD